MLDPNEMNAMPCVTNRGYRDGPYPGLLLEILLVEVCLGHILADNTGLS